MAIIISQKVKQKLVQKVPPVTFDEIKQCFENRTSRIPIEHRPQHRTRPPTRWFISETDFGRRLKVVFMLTRHGNRIIKTAYEPDEIEEMIYEIEAHK